MGAPGVEGGGIRGAVYWYEPVRSTSHHAYGGVVNNPSSYDDAEFGFAIAALDKAASPETP
ncbi:MAG: hypothetical protein ACI9VR_000593 [Cognaticolwellia sp.]